MQRCADRVYAKYSRTLLDYEGATLPNTGFDPLICYSNPQDCRLYEQITKEETFIEILLDSLKEGACIIPIIPGLWKVNGIVMRNGVRQLQQ